MDYDIVEAFKNIEDELKQAKNEFVKYSGSVDEKGEKIYRSRFIEDQHIVYLSSYDDFSTQERGIFKKMLK